jgi:ATP-dependent Clp protease ATP-binding subunit ClpA
MNHPFFIVMVLVGIGTGLLTIYQYDPSLMPYIMGAGLVCLFIRWWQLHWEAQRSKRASVSIDFKALRERDISKYADWLKENVRGHDDVVDVVVKKLQRGLGLAGHHRTLGAFMLVGPTGTGKTFLAELIAKALYPDAEPVILRMNQYKDPADIDALIGSAPGSMGAEAGGALTRPVLENPGRAIILDEFDKCHPEIQHCFYEILDTGKCREKSSGRVVHFNACAVFATCNAGVEELRGIFEKYKDPTARGGRLRDAMASVGFEKALVARFDEILLMDELAPIHIAEVVALQLAKHWRQYGIEVTYASPEILMEAVRRNNQFREYGVRQLARLVQDLTDASLAQAKKDGVTQVRLDIDRATGEITIA